MMPPPPPPPHLQQVCCSRVLCDAKVHVLQEALGNSVHHACVKHSTAQHSMHKGLGSKQGRREGWQLGAVLHHQP